MPRELMRFLLLLSLLCTGAGCGNDPGKSSAVEKSSSAAKTGKTSTTDELAAISPTAINGYANLFPADTIAYVRIRDVQRVKDELINPKHVKDAAKVQERINTLIMQGIKSLASNGGQLGVTLGSLTRFVFDLQSIHVGVGQLNLGDNSIVPDDPDVLVVLESRTDQGFAAVRSDLQPKLKTETIAGIEVHRLTVAGRVEIAFFSLNPTTVVVGPKSSIEKALRRMKSSDEKSLAESRRFRTAFTDWGKTGELFLFVDFDNAQRMTPFAPRFSTISCVAAVLGLEDGFSLRAYAAEGKAFPQFLVRTPRGKKFLSQIPADAVFLLGTGTDGGGQTRRNFVDWIMQELGQDTQSATQLLPERMRTFAMAHRGEPDSIETDAFALLKDLWAGVLPVKSESAFFVAPDAQGRWGAAYLFDVNNRKDVAGLTEKLKNIGTKAKLPWSQTTHDGQTIHYIDFADVAKTAGKPVLENVTRQAQLQVGYAVTDTFFLVGTVESLKFAIKPTGKTLITEIPFDNLDEKNAIMLTLRPGRILHRTFGVPELDDVLKRLASQIPKDSNYSVTLNFLPQQLTMRTNIPFISLFGWLAVEMTSEGPAGLRGMMTQPGN